MTPPDGTMPRMRMYVWDVATPWRDGDLEAGIVIHEYR
jgi:extracellular elastinolytic metalloproteinase